MDLAGILGSSQPGAQIQGKSWNFIPGHPCTCKSAVPMKLRRRHSHSQRIHREWTEHSTVGHTQHSHSGFLLSHPILGARQERGCRTGLPGCSFLFFQLEKSRKSAALGLGCCLRAAAKHEQRADSEERELWTGEEQPLCRERAGFPRERREQGRSRETLLGLTHGSLDREEKRPRVPG